MSGDRALAYGQIRYGGNKPGNEAWCAAMMDQALRAMDDVPEGIEKLLGFGVEEKILWRLLAAPRPFEDLVNTRLLLPNETWAMLRGLEAAGWLMVAPLPDAYAITQGQISKLREEITGNVASGVYTFDPADLIRPEEKGGAASSPPLVDDDVPSLIPQPIDMGEITDSKITPVVPAGQGVDAGFIGDSKITPLVPTLDDLGPEVLSDSKITPLGGGPPMPGAVATPGPPPPRPAAPLTGMAAAAAQARQVSTAPVRSRLDDATRKAIESAAADAQKDNLYEVLGVAAGASDGNLKKAYITRIKAIHPDTLGETLHDEPELAAAASMAFAKATEAWELLSDSSRRQAYDQQQQLMKSSEKFDASRKAAEAKTQIRMAGTFVNKKDYGPAILHLETALALDENNAEAHTLLAWAQYLNPVGEEAVRASDARSNLAAILRQFKYADAAYRLGLLMRNSGSEIEAAKYFGQALRLDREHPGAQQERRLARMRDKKGKDKVAGAQQKSGLLSGLFGGGKPKSRKK
jgi:curved DNA-binding protein CbpA